MKFLSNLVVLLPIAYSYVYAMDYPRVKRDDAIVDNYHGVQVRDPYRWLEDLDSVETKEFVGEQNNRSQHFLSGLEDREKIRRVLTSLVNYERFTAPVKKQGKYFYFYNGGLQGHDVLLKLDDLTSQEEVLFDPNSLSEDGSISIYPYYQSFSPDGSKFVYALATNGSDWMSGHILDVGTGQVFTDTLMFIKWPQFSFSKSSNGVFYSRLPLGEDGQPETIGSQIYYHQLGTEQEEDFFVYQDSEYPEWFLKAETSHDGDYLIVTPEPDFKSNSILIGDLRQFNVNGSDSNLPKTFLTVSSTLEDPSRFGYVTNVDNQFIFLSDKNAPNFRLVTVDIDIQTGIVGEVTILVEEHSKNILKWVAPIDKDKLLLCYFEDVKHKLELRKMTDGSFLQNIDFPFDGVIKDNDYSAMKENNEFFFKVENLVNPGSVVRCVASPSSDKFDCSIWKEIRLGQGVVDLSEFIMDQVFFESSDGVTVPMFVSHRKNISLDGGNAALLFGYGGFNVDVLPTFSPFTLGFIHYFNGVYASANIRGGGEYGEKWHEAGAVLKKQNSFNDFQSAAEYLVSKKYTSKEKLTVQGSSNGGLLVAACINQRPDLFGVALPDVG